MPGEAKRLLEVEEALRESEVRYELALREIDEGIIKLNEALSQQTATAVTPTDRTHITQAGFDAFLAKPMVLREFVDTVKRLSESGRK